MDAIEFSHECTRLNREIQAILQQRIAHRGDPRMTARLQPHVTDCLKRSVSLEGLGEQKGFPLHLLQDAKRLLNQHFPELTAATDEP